MADIFDQIHAQQAAKPAGGGDVFDQIHAQQLSTGGGANVLDDPSNVYQETTPEGIPVYKPRSLGQQLYDIPAGVWENLSQSGEGLMNLLTTRPDQTLAGIGKQQDALRVKAVEAFKKGDLTSAAAHALYYLLPLIGPQLDQAGEMAANGQWGRSTGNTLGILGQLYAPEALKAAFPKIPLSPKIGIKPQLNPVEQASQSYLDQAGVDTTLSMQTGSKTVRNLEGSVQNDIGGSGYAQDARNATRSQVQSLAQQEMDQVSPAPATPEQAGSGLLRKVKSDIAALDLQANDAYKKTWQIERDPRNMKQVPKQVRTPQGWDVVTDPNTGHAVMENMPLPIDMRPMKMALRPIAERYARTMAPTQRNASLGLSTMRDIISGPDYKPVSQAEMDLGLLKQAARTEKGMAQLRNESQGLSAYSVGQLQQDIDSTVSSASGGQQAIGELQRGRSSTAKKWGIYEQTRKFGSPNIEDLEPVGVFNKLTGDRDIRAQFLRRVRAMAPAEMPKIGRAVLQQILDRVFREGDIGHSHEALNSWDAIGPEAKAVFFPGRTQQLDNLFVSLKRLAKEPNPSGSGYIVAMNNLKSKVMSGAGLALGFGAGGVEGAGIGLLAGAGLHVISNNVLARMLYNPKWAGLLQRGIQLQLGGDKVGAAVAATQLVKMAGRDVQPVGQKQKPHLSNFEK